MIKSSGILVFDPKSLTRKHEKQASWKRTAYIKIEDDVDSYYRWFLNRRFGLNLQKPIRGAHITIINDKIDNNFTEQTWNQAKEVFQNKEICFEFNSDDIRSNGEHWYIKIKSDDAMNIRNAIGLGDPYYGFHLTLGRIGDEVTHRLEHSHYILRQILKFGI